MKPVPFTYVAATSVEEAVQWLAGSNGEAKIIAGGQSLLPILNMRLSRPSMLVDINRIPALNIIEICDDELRIGATVRHAQAEHSALIKEYAPLLAKAIPLVGHIPIRTRGTLVGSVVHADPSAEIPLAALLLDAYLQLQSKSGTRTVPLEEFFYGYMMTDLQADEMATSLVIPLQALPSGAKRGTSFQEVARREGDFALVCVGCQLDIKEGVIHDVRLGVGGVSGVPLRLTEAEEFMRGKEATSQLFAEAARFIDQLDIDDDPAVSAEYRRRVAIGLTQRALEEAFKEADSEGGVR